MGGSYAGWWGGALFSELCAAPSSGLWAGAREVILGGGRGRPVRDSWHEWTSYFR